jgi:hypothetical protein
MIILGIDPGNIESAYLCLNGENKILHFGKVINEKLLLFIHKNWNKIDHIGIEIIASYGMTCGKTVFDTCIFIGRIQQKLIDLGYSNQISFLARKTIVTHICDNPKANDAAVHEAMVVRYGDKGKRNNPGPTFGIKADIWSALAIATYCTDLKNGKIK